mmetsp:Transcript_10630/g.12404  ORF Transcript_10630/g.12404 Transcript_10630/m.12404 type:complete len:164 (-) Transcript_10630:334-825(-)
MARPAKREVAETCFELLNIEMVRLYHEKDDTSTARAALESIGFQVGHQLAERYSMDRPRFSEHLDVIKFICKEFWIELFKKPVDNLKTNRHREIFVLHDNKFRWLRHVSLAANTPQGSELVARYLVFPCGVVKGALASFGVPCEVTADILDTPGSCSFQVRIK